MSKHSTNELVRVLGHTSQNLSSINANCKGDLFHYEITFWRQVLINKAGSVRKKNTMILNRHIKQL